MGKNCWKCKKNISFGKKSFNLDNFKFKNISTPENFRSGDYLCIECFPQIAITCRKNNKKGFEYLYELTYNQIKKGKNVDELTKRKNELKKQEEDFEKGEGKRCFKCGKTTPWVPDYKLTWVRDNASLLGLDGYGPTSMFCKGCWYQLMDRKQEIVGLEQDVNQKNLEHYGKIIKETPSGLYYGGHKAY